MDDRKSNVSFAIPTSSGVLVAPYGVSLKAEKPWFSVVVPTAVQSMSGVYDSVMVTFFGFAYRYSSPVLNASSRPQTPFW